MNLIVSSSGHLVIYRIIEPINDQMIE